MILRLFFEFFKIGLFAIGGGMATIPFLYDLSASSGWFTEEQIVDMIAVSESTPGPIGINMATYVGYTTAGPLGSLIATLGEITPGIIIVSVFAYLLAKIRNNFYVESVFYGVRPCSAGLIAGAGFSLLTVSMFDKVSYELSGKISDFIQLRNLILFAFIWVLTNRIKKTKKLHPIYFIAFSALIGVLIL